MSRNILQNKIVVNLSKYSMYIYLGHYVVAKFVGGVMGLRWDLQDKMTRIIMVSIVVMLTMPLCYLMRKYDLRNGKS